MDTTRTRDLLDQLEGIPQININANLRAALAAERRVTSVVKEVAALRCGSEKLAAQEYFYYRLWDRELSMVEKRRFVGKVRQKLIHDAANVEAWRVAAADKVVWHTLMVGLGLPTPQTVAVTQPTRVLPGAETTADTRHTETVLRRPDLYPLFAKPIAGRYSLNVLSAEAYDRDTDSVPLTGGDRKGVGELAASLHTGGGFLLQRRLSPHPTLAAVFGPRLWSVRLLVFLTPGGPLIHRAVAKIATGSNPADNFWRAGNMLGAIDHDGRIYRVVRGSGIDQKVDEPHPDTHAPIVGTVIPDWPQVLDLARTAAVVFPGIRTQSWDIALSDQGPVLLEVNYGGDLNLSQLAHGKGVLDEVYVDHLRACGYRARR